MKTMQQWHDSKLNFSEFAQPGDFIDEELYWYFLEVLPPITWFRKDGIVLNEIFQVGEPMDQQGKNGAFRYESFKSYIDPETNKKVYQYIGIQERIYDESDQRV